MSDRQRFEAGLAIIKEAGALALNYFNNRNVLKIEHKGLQDVVSQADVEVEKLIRARLGEKFPQDAFLGEETGRTDYSPEQGIWVVDPIDGTQPFVCGLTSWCVSMAYVKSGEVRFGMVFAPARTELFAGGVEFPATCNGVAVEKREAKSVRDGLIGTGYSPKSSVEDFLPGFERLLRAGGMFYRDGSGALGVSYVAAGRLIGFYEPIIKSWDCLGAVAIVHAAGLKTNDFLANDGLWQGNWLIAANEAVYDEIKGIAGYC